MSNVSTSGDDFISQVEQVIQENISNEQFGVSELAEAMNMSRSNLLRKVKKDTELSASQFIRKVRLKKGLDLLQQTSLNVSEVSYEVGFGSTSYFIKCFREQYGYSPGEAGKMAKEPAKSQISYFHKYRLIIGGSLLLAIIITILVLFNNFGDKTVQPELEKSIAVLPFKNESSDSANIYFINGLMESTLNNLQKIKDLRVISRTSVEKYRNTDKSIPEIAEELDVNYFIEGSGQKVGDQVLLNIQLIEANSDKHLWGEQYNRQMNDIFLLQNEVATKIAASIKAYVSVQELEQIKKRPTENLEAYDYYLKALEPFQARTADGLRKAIPLFKKAIEHDPGFAVAYADVAISYYFLDLFQVEKKYTDEINNYADKALLYDSKSDQSLLAKAFYYMQTEQYASALPHLEKALEYNPNSSAIIQTLADIYSRLIPNTAKYLEYALKGMQLNVAANDSIQKSYLCLHLANALFQNGFVDEAIEYMDKSINYFPNNEYSYVRDLMLCARDENLEKTGHRLLKKLQQDTTRLDIIQEVAKNYYLQENYDSAFYYYQKFTTLQAQIGMNIFPQEDIKIAFVYRKVGDDKQASKFFEAYEKFCQNDESIYKSASLANKYAYEGKDEEAIEQLKLFSQQHDFQYWLLVYIKIDPIMASLKSHPEYSKVLKDIEDNFWKNQSKLKMSLEGKGLM